jgi:2-polyprenyl-6-hydroxyphenyl methylase/3-demethylubiquinone-9 3-methyltransferase
MLDERSRYYDKMVAADDWDSKTNPFETRRRLELIFDVLLRDEDLNGRKLLDGGSGGGHFSQVASERGADVTSLDVGDNLLAQVAKRCDTRRVLGSVLDLPFEAETFDIVLSTEVIEHTPDPRLGIRELCRVVKPGGLLVLTSPNRLWQAVVRGATRLELRAYAGHENFLWAHEARDLVVESGLSVETFLGFNALPLFRPFFEPALAWADRLGERFPRSYVNWAIRARKSRV